jgi:hypothetical protein
MASITAQQQLSRFAELLLGEEDTEAVRMVIEAVATNSTLRKKMAMMVRDFCAQGMRPEIRKFAGLMEMKLRKHDPARGQRWKTGDAEHHLERISYIVAELEEAVSDGRRIGLKAADLANHAMMLADQAGELEDA